MNERIVPPPIVSADALRVAIGYEDLIEPVSRAFQVSSAGRAQNGLLVLRPGENTERGDVYVKSGVIRGERVFVVKVAPWFAANVDSGEPQGGSVAVFDAATGHTRAILDEQHYLSDIRTAAAGALAARVLAPAAVTTGAVLGSGVQAYWQSLALYRERPFERLLVWARSASKGEALIGKLRARLPHVAISAAASVEAAVRGANVIITATVAREPLVRGDWLQPGQHITAVGADDASKCEVDATVLNRGRVFVDDRATNLAYGDVYRAVAAGAFDPDALAGELGEVLAGSVPGRLGAEDITVAKLVGVGVQDVAAAQAALEKLGLLQ